MRDPIMQPTPRRGFVGRLLGGAAALAGGAVLGREARAQVPASTASTAPRADSRWDMSWTERVTGAHRQVFDAPEIAEGTVLHQARTWMSGYAEVYGATDAAMSAVLVIRHAAVPMVANDLLWDSLELGAKVAEMSADRQPVKDPATGAPARRNPFLNANVKSGDRHSMLWPDGGLDTLLQRGAIVLACDLAMRRLVGLVAQKEKVNATRAKEIVLANLVPGVIVMPSGIFAVTRAQEAGCQYIRAT